MLPVSQYAIATATFMLTIGSIFGIILWIQIYLNTYMHFPQMDKHQRILMSVKSATIAAVTLMIAVSLFMY
jgi:hypothetical protein